MAVGEGEGCARLRRKDRGVMFTDAPLLPLLTSQLALRMPRTTLVSPQVFTIWPVCLLRCWNLPDDSVESQ